MHTKAKEQKPFDGALDDGIRTDLLSSYRHQQRIRPDTLVRTLKSRQTDATSHGLEVVSIARKHAWGEGRAIATSLYMACLDAEKASTAREQLLTGLCCGMRST